MSSHPSAQPSQRSDRRPLFPQAPLWLGVWLLLCGIAFYPSYLARLGEVDLSRHLHGISASLWLMLLLTQAVLVRRRLMAWHQTLGRASLLLAPVFVVSGLLLVQDMARGHTEFQRLFGARLAVMDLGSVLYFAGAYGLALHWRRTRALHARLMLSTAMLAMPPVIVRLIVGTVPGVDSFELGVHLSYLLCEALALCLLLRDWQRSEPRAPYAALLVYFVLQHGAFVAVPGWQTWNAFFAGLGGR